MDHDGQTPRDQRTRAAMFFRGGLRIRITGWRGWVWAVGGLYFWLWLTAALIGAIPRAAFLATLLVAVAAGLGWGLVLFGPSPLSAPLASPADAQRGSTGRSWPFVAACLAIAALGVLVRLVLWKGGGILVLGGLAGVWGHLWDNSRWKVRSDELGSHKAAMREMLEELRGRA